MGRHIVGAFGRMDVAIVLGNKLGEKVIEISQHIRVGIFLDRQAGGGMAQENVTDTALDFRFGDDGLNFAGDFGEGLALGADGELLLIVRHGAE